MPVKHFRMLTIGTGLILAGIMAWCIISGQSMWVPIAAIAAAIVIKLVSRKRVNEPIVDERVNSISNQASAITYRVLLFLMAIASFIIVLLGDAVPDEVRIAGTTLAFAAGVMMFFYLSCYYYLAARS